MNYETSGMHRRPDHDTCIKAARGVRRFTLREQVIDFAKSSLAHGFTDDELKAAQPQRPESSLRKRRTELAQENILVETGFTRANRHGQDEKVWMHRDFHPSPPPIIERDTTPQQSKVARLEAEVAKLVNLLALAGPYVECAADETEVYSKDGIERIKKLARDMRAAIQPY